MFFQNIKETMKNAGWLSVFLKYMLKSEFPEHLFLYLDLVQFRKRKDEDLAKKITYLYISKSAPLAPDPEVCPGLTGRFAGCASA